MGFMSWYRSMLPGKPTYTEKDVPDLSGKVIIVTGANTGVGKDTARILYSKNAKVYALARSEEKMMAAIDEIKAATPNSKGQIIYHNLDLSDLTKIKSSAESFLTKEKDLHILINNAGVAFGAKGRKTVQDYEICIGTNCVGTFLFTKLLIPLLRKTAATSPPASVRIVWTSSSGVLVPAPNTFMQKMSKDADLDSGESYPVSKLGNYLQAAECARRLKDDGIASVSLNPGNLDSDLYRGLPPFLVWIMRRTILFPQIYGSYTTLWSALAKEVTMERSGSFVTPWGRFGDDILTKDLIDAVKTKEEGGLGIATEFWDWTEKEIEPFL